MSGETAEYAVLRRAGGVETVDPRTVTADVGQARAARDNQQSVADFKARECGAGKVECVLVMRTCTPWCEVADGDPFKKNKEKENGKG